MTEALTWSRLEDAIAVLPAWRRIGREWHGPCPVTGVGQHTCWFAAGDRAEIRGGCRRCGTKLSATDFISHVDALVGRTSAPPSFRPRVPPRSAVFPHPRPAALWAVAKRVSPDTPAYRYLTVHRRVVSPGESVPASVRWISSSDAFRFDCSPSLPRAAAGAVLYRFSPPGETVTAAVQLEALAADGAALPFRLAGKRPSVAGSFFDRGRRVFVAAVGRPGCGCWLVEGPLDAMALVRLGALGLEDLQGASVFGVAGAPAGFQLRACSVSGTVVLAPDPDPAGDLSVLRLGAVLASLHRSYRVRRPVPCMDWSDMALEASLEQEMLHERPA